MLNIKTLNILNALKNVPDNEIAVVEENKKVYIYKENSWQEYVSEDGGLKISLLELNQIAVTQLPAYTKKQIKKAKQLISDYCLKDNETSNRFMLLSNELKYYTVFETKCGISAMPAIEDEVILCLEEIGTIKSISKNNDGVIECWITVEDQSYPLYLFDFTKGVIVCR